MTDQKDRSAIVNALALLANAASRRMSTMFPGYFKEEGKICQDAQDALQDEFFECFCEALLAEHGGVVPDTRKGLMALPGIGRKCADIVMSFTFGADVIAVDTHVHRVANRIGLTNAKTADETAKQLEKRAPGWALHDGHFWLIQFGKRICVSRRPKCEACPVSDLCLYYRTMSVD